MNSLEATRSPQHASGMPDSVSRRFSAPPVCSRPTSHFPAGQAPRGSRTRRCPSASQDHSSQVYPAHARPRARTALGPLPGPPGTRVRVPEPGGLSASAAARKEGERRAPRSAAAAAAGWCGRSRQGWRRRRRGLVAESERASHEAARQEARKSWAEEGVLEAPAPRTCACRERGRPGSLLPPRALRAPRSAFSTRSGGQFPTACSCRPTWNLGPAPGTPRWSNPPARRLLPLLFWVCKSTPGESSRRPPGALKKLKQNVPGTHAGKTSPWNCRREVGGANLQSQTLRQVPVVQGYLHAIQQVKWCSLDLDISASGTLGKN